MRAKKTTKADKGSKSNVADERAYIVPAVDRAVRILSLLKKEGREMSMAEVAGATGWHKSSVHKILVTLNHHGFVDRDLTTKQFSLGVRLSEYGRLALNRLDIRHAAKPYLKALVEYSGETANLSVLRGSEIILVDVEEPPNQLRVTLYVGMRAPATMTSNGKAILAFLPENRANEILGKEGLPVMTPKSITRIGSYRADLAVVRKRGYATDFEEYEQGVVGISSPVFDSRGQVTGTISIAGPAFRMTRGKVRGYGKQISEMASRLSETLS